MNRCSGHTIFATHVRATNGIDYAIAIECRDCGARAVGHFIDPRRVHAAGARFRATSISIAPPRPRDVPPSKPWVPPDPKLQPTVKAEWQSFTFRMNVPPQKTATEEAIDRARRERHEQGESHQAPDYVFDKATGDALWAAFREDMKKRRPGFYVPPF